MLEEIEYPVGYVAAREETVDGLAVGQIDLVGFHRGFLGR
jgi:hypothetical protein